MATQTTVDSARISRKIRSAHGGVRSVLEIEEVWTSMSEDEQIDFSIEWTNDAGKIRILSTAQSRGELDDEQVGAFDALKEDLRKALPVLDRLELQKPGISL